VIPKILTIPPLIIPFTADPEIVTGGGAITGAAGILANESGLPESLQALIKSSKAAKTLTLIKNLFLAIFFFLLIRGS